MAVAATACTCELDPAPWHPLSDALLQLRAHGQCNQCIAIMGMLACQALHCLLAQGVPACAECTAQRDACPGHADADSRLAALRMTLVTR